MEYGDLDREKIHIFGIQQCFKYAFCQGKLQTMKQNAIKDSFKFEATQELLNLKYLNNFRLKCTLIMCALHLGWHWQTYATEFTRYMEKPNG